MQSNLYASIHGIYLLPAAGCVPSIRDTGWIDGLHHCCPFQPATSQTATQAPACKHA